jgi:superfamily II DNA or RNA helicase
MELRPYQREAAQAIEREWEQGRRRTMAVMATGCGKTVLFADVVRRCVEGGGRALVMAHRSELLDQAGDKIQRLTGLGYSVEKANLSCSDSFFPVTVGSVQTLCRDGRLSALGPDRFQLVVVDEAHHAAAKSYCKVLEHFSGARVLGVTATPDRHGLGDVFDSVAYEYGMDRAVREGYLVPISAQTIPLQIDLTGARKRSGDWAAEDVASALDPYMDAIAEEMLRAGCLERKTVVFLPLVATSKRFCEVLRAHGFRAAEVNGASEDRAEILSRFATGDYDVLCNAMLLTEGWDCPSVDCVVPLRATQSRPLYCQMVGRGTRPSPETGKTDLLLLDFLWQTQTHALVRPAHLVCSDDEVADRMAEIAQDADAPVDLMGAQRQAETDVVALREQALAAKLREMRNRRRKCVDPLQFAVSVNAFDLVDYEAVFAWQRKPPTQKQLDALERAGIDTEAVVDAGQASLLMDHIVTRSKLGLATPKMIRRLEQYGFSRVGTWTFEEASAMIGHIAANGWRPPHDVDPATYVPESQRVAS